MNKQRAEQLVNDHWVYIGALLKNSGLSEREIERIGFHYKSSGIHFYGHAIEDCNNEFVNPIGGSYE